MIQPESDYLEKTFKNLDMAGEDVKSCTFQDCNFIRCRFTETVFRNCKFSHCVFDDCDLSLMEVPNSSIGNARFVKSKAVGVNWAQAHWPDKSIWGPIEFNKCALSHSTFLGIDLTEMKMRRCEAINVDFRESNLSGADFKFTDLKDSLFLSTNLEGADLRYARNYQIDPSQNIIIKAQFSLPEAMALLYSMDIEILEI
jgi:fluoroquinolone resistance protein